MEKLRSISQGLYAVGRKRLPSNESLYGMSATFNGEIAAINLTASQRCLLEQRVYMSQQEGDGLKERIEKVRQRLSEALYRSQSSQTGNTNPESVTPDNPSPQTRGSKPPNRILSSAARIANVFLGSVSPLYMNKETVYTEDYFEQNHLKRLNSWYGGFVRGYYRYIAEECMAKPAELQRGVRVLDIGCGVGILVQQFNRLGYRATGVDVNEAAIRYSLEPQNCQLVESTAQLPYTDKYFDLVVSREVLEHIPAEAVDACIEEWDRVSNGKMVHIIAVTERGKSATEDPTHINVQSEDWWVSKFQQFGYDVIRNPSPYFISVFGPKGYLMAEKP